jgi:hypothetical protein
MLEKPGLCPPLNQCKKRREGERSLGRPSHPQKDDKIPEIIALREEGKSIRDIAEAVGVGKSTVSEWLESHDASRDVQCPESILGHPPSAETGVGKGQHKAALPRL